MTWFDKIPDEYQEHLPGPPPSRKETFQGLGERALEEGTEPFLKVGEGIKDSLKRIYKVAVQPIGAEEPIKPKPFGEAPFEFLGSLAAYVVALPIKMVKEVIEGGERAMEGASLLRGGPRGELGEWTPEQMTVEGEALNLTIGAMVGGAPGAGTGVANIGRKDALKMLAKEFRGMAKPKKTFVPTGTSEKGLVQHFAKKIEQPSQVTYQGMEEGYRRITKGLRDIPQDVLDMAKEVGLAPPKRTDIAGRIIPKESRIEYQITKHLPKESIPHEFLHAMQLHKIGHAKKGVPGAVLEAHAYEFEPLFMREVAKLPKGKRIDTPMFERLYSEAFQSMLKKYGRDFSKYKMKDIVSRGHLERKGARRGELQSAAPPKIGELVELPGGKARFDGTWEAFGKHPERQQYTFLEGVAKGDTFVSGSHKAADVAAAGLRKIKMRGGS